MRELSLQDAFDEIVAHLSSQGKRSINKVKTCVYRNGDGLKCAVGALIPDDVYSDRIEGNDLHDIVHDFGWKSLGFQPRDGDVIRLREFLMSAQGIHDSYPIKTWPRSLAKLALEYDLDPKMVYEVRWNFPEDDSP